MSLEEVRVKQEPECVFNEHVQVKEEEEFTNHVKEELVYTNVKVEWEDSAAVHGVGGATQAVLYAGHELKDELVLGPEGLQPPDVVFSLHAGQTSETREQPVLVRSSSPSPPAPLRSEAGRAASLQKRVEHASEHESGATDGSGNGSYNDAPKSMKKRINADSSATPERIEHRVNVTAILELSNATPFRDKTTRGFSCLYCSQYFPNIDDLRAHTAQQAEKDKLNSMLDFKLYKPIRLDITGLECTVCHQPMRDLNELKDHLVFVHNETIYRGIKDIIIPFRLESGPNFTCVICSAVYTSFKSLYNHMSSHFNNYSCSDCGTGCMTIAALRKHIKIHEKASFSCSYCDKSYSSSAKKRNHEKGVHKDGWLRNKCPHCPEIFVNYYDLGEHLATVHNESPVTYPCNACDKVYGKKLELNRHIRHGHLQQRRFCCHNCDAEFISKRSLVDHANKHFGGVHACDICGKNFTRAKTLREHVIAHDEDKRLQCEICKKTFGHKRNLITHMRLHQDRIDRLGPKHSGGREGHLRKHGDDRRFQCKMCKMSFVQNRSLENHIRLHRDGIDTLGPTDHTLEDSGGEHICDICAETFSTAWTLEEHLRKHDAYRRFQCVVCKRIFAHKGNLNSHMRLHRNLTAIATGKEKGLNTGTPSIQYKRY